MFGFVRTLVHKKPKSVGGAGTRRLGMEWKGGNVVNKSDGAMMTKSAQGGKKNGWLVS